MNEYETEEQQVEAVKKWLKENLSSLILGLGVGVFALGGWNYYVTEKNNHAFQASTMYMQAAQLMASNGVDEKVIDINNKLDNDFSDTPYASITSLLIAKKEYEKGNAEEAISQLEWVYKHAPADELKQLASLRLARILIDQQKLEQAMGYLTQAHDAAFDAVFEELKGDIFVAKGQIAEARVAYDKAIRLKGSASKWLQLKRQNLGENELAEVAAG